MQTKARAWILTSVVAVTGAYIIGVNEPVRAQEVTYNIENAYLTSGNEVTGSIDYDNGEIVGGTLTIDDALYVGDDATGGLDINKTNSPDQIFFFTPQIAGSRYFEITLDEDLTGAEGQTVEIVNSESGYVAEDGYDIPLESGGDVTDVVASTPEPSSTMGTVLAVTFGLVLRGKRRKLSTREKERIAHER